MPLKSVFSPCVPLEPQASWPCFVERAFCAISVPDSDSDADAAGAEGRTDRLVSIRGSPRSNTPSHSSVIYAAAAAQGSGLRLHLHLGLHLGLRLCVRLGNRWA